MAWQETRHFPHFYFNFSLSASTCTSGLPSSKVFRPVYFLGRPWSLPPQVQRDTLGPVCAGRFARPHVQGKILSTCAGQNPIHICREKSHPHVQGDMRDPVCIAKISTPCAGLISQLQQSTYVHLYLLLSSSSALMYDMGGPKCQLWQRTYTFIRISSCPPTMPLVYDMADALACDMGGPKS